MGIYIKMGDTNTDKPTRIEMIKLDTRCSKIKETDSVKFN